MPHKGQEHPLVANEANDGKRPPQSPTATDIYFLPAPARRLSLLGSVGWAGVAPKPLAGSINGDNSDRTSERNRYLVSA